MPVAQEDDGVGPGGRLRLVGHHDHRLPQVVDAAAQDLQDLVGGVGVQVAGGLVGEDDRRLAHERPGAGHALDLTAGELGRPVGQALPEADGVDHLVEALRVDLLAGDIQGQGDVLRRREGGDQVEGLEDEADALAAQAGEATLVHGGDHVAVEHDLPGGDRVQAGQAVHERGLAGAGRPHDGGEAGAGDVDVDGVERCDGARSAAVDLGEVACGDHGVIHRMVRCEDGGRGDGGGTTHRFSLAVAWDG